MKTLSFFSAKRRLFSFRKKLNSAKQKVSNWVEKLWDNKAARLIISAVVLFAGAIIPIYVFFFSVHPPQVLELKCEGIAENLDVPVARPLFSWTFKDIDAHCYQDSAYVHVGTQAGDNSMWNLRIESPQNQIQYCGKILENNKTYHWNVYVVDNDGLCSQVQHSTFKTNWQAKTDPPFQIFISHREMIDRFLLDQYLKQISRLFGMYKDAQAGESCFYSFVFDDTNSGVFSIKVSFESTKNSKNILIADSIAVDDVEIAFLTLVERVNNQIAFRLDNYNQSISF